MEPTQVIERFVALGNDAKGEGAPETEEGRALLALVHPDYEMYENGRLALRGRDGVAQRMRALKAGAPAFRQDIVEQVAQGPIVVTRWTMSGMDAAPDEPVDGMTWTELRDGQLFRVHQWWESDTVSTIVRE